MTPAHPRRLVLALALDALMSLTLATMCGLTPGRAAASGWAVWFAASALLLTVCALRFGATPASACLGITRIAGRLSVLSRWSERERWWTVCIALLAIAEGAKEAVRFRGGLPAPPCFGQTLPLHLGHVWVSALGLTSIACGLGVLSCRRGAAAAAALLAGTQAISWLVSLPTIAVWVAARSTARYAQRGQAVPVGEITRLTLMLPAGAICGNFIALLWMIRVYQRFSEYADITRTH